MADIDAVKLANVVLDQHSRDPDDDLSTLARCFLREIEAKDALISEVKRLREAGDWQPIETAPSGKVVLLWKEKTREHYVACRVHGEHGLGWCTPDGFEIFGATKWRPLPDPPRTLSEVG